MIVTLQDVEGFCRERNLQLRSGVYTSVETPHLSHHWAMITCESGGMRYSTRGAGRNQSEAMQKALHSWQSSAVHRDLFGAVPPEQAEQ